MIASDRMRQAGPRQVLKRAIQSRMNEVCFKCDNDINTYAEKKIIKKIRECIGNRDYGTNNDTMKESQSKREENKIKCIAQN